MDNDVELRKTNMNKLCIYHADCVDGLAAAAVVRRAFGETVEFHAGRYGEEPPEVEGRLVIIVDFSYPPAQLLKMLEKTTVITLLDHHKTAIEAIAAEKLLLERTNFHPVLNQELSGAGLAWEHLFPNEPMPEIIRHVQDRDLWRFKMPGSREIHAVLSTLPPDPVLWSEVIFKIPIEDTIKDGSAIMTYHDMRCLQLQDIAREVEIDYTLVPAVNAPWYYTSDVAGQLAKGRAFAACWYIGADGLEHWSLRSEDGARDVARVAQKFGGGGHRHAAGFKVAHGHFKL